MYTCKLKRVLLLLYLSDLAIYTTVYNIDIIACLFLITIFGTKIKITGARDFAKITKTVNDLYSSYTEDE